MATLNAIYKIAADISNLQSPVDRAVQTLQKLEGSTSRIEDGFSKVTKVMGAFGIGLSIGAVVNFGKALLDDADALVKLSDKTGISLQWLQKFQVAGDDAGNTVEQLTLAVSQMQNRLAGGDASAVAALGKLHLSLEDIKDLSPEQQFVAIADAIREMHDPAEQVNVAMDLFGRSGAEILPTIKRGFDDLKDASVGMSDETVKALDTVGDAWSRAVRTMKGMAAEGLVNLFTGANTAKEITQQLNLAEAYHFTGEELAALHAPQAKYIELSDAATLSTTDQAAIEKTLGLRLAVVTDAQRARTTATKLATDAEKAATTAGIAQWKSIQEINERVLAGVPALGSWQKGQHLAGEAVSKTTGLLISQVGVLQAVGLGAVANARQMTELYQAGHEGATSFIKLTEAGRVVPSMLAEVSRASSLTNDWFVNLREGAGSLGDSLGGSLRDVLSRIPDLLTKAFTGGGGILGAAKAIGVQFAEAFLKPTVTGLSTVQKTALVLGATVGAGAIVAGASWQSAMGQVGLAATGVVTTAALATGATVAGTVALGAMTLGIGAAAIGVALLIKKFMGVSKEIKEARKALGEFESALWSTMTATQALEAGGDAWKNTVITVRDAYLATGRTAEEALEAVGALWDTDNPARMAAAMREINGVLGLQTAAHDALAGALERYKFSTEELGPAMANQKLSEQAKQLYQDWQVLIGAGIDIAAVGREMQGSINEFVQTSMRMKTDVDPAMRPMLQSMIEMGLLTDAAGNQITDLEGSGITFAMTMSQGFQSIVTAVKSLTDVIRISLGLAIDETADKIRNVPDINVGVHYNDPGFKTSFDYEPMARGGYGRVTSPTLFLAGEAGPEDVAFSGANKHFGGGGGGGVSIVVNVNAQGGYFDTPASLNKLAAKVSEAVMQQQRRLERVA